MQILTKSVKGWTRSIILLFLVLFSFVYHAKSQLIIKDHYYDFQAKSLVQKYFANSSIIIDNVYFYGETKLAIGSFTGGDIANLGITSGIVLSNGNVIDIPGSHSDTLNGEFGNLGYDSLDVIFLTGNSFDANTIRIEFTPLTDSIWFRYVLASEEFSPFDSVPKDVFGFLLSGPDPNNPTHNFYNKNLALFPGTNVYVRIDSFANAPYNNYYISNSNDTTAIKFDGLTKVLTAGCKVVPCQKYIMDISIEDKRSDKFDSGIFLEAGSLSTTDTSVSVKGTNGDDGMVEKCGTAKFIFHRETTTPTPQTVNFEISGTATNGLDYTDTLGYQMPNSVTFPANQKQVELKILAVPDVITEPTETVIIKLLNAPSCGIDTVKTILYLKNTEPFTVKAIGDTTICTEAKDKLKLTAIVNGGVKPYKFYWLEGTSTDTTTVPKDEISEFETSYDSENEKPFLLYHVLVIDSCLEEITSNDVTVIIKCPIKTTNVITPNGDDFNQYFFIKHLIEYPNSTLVILNRWGRKVYETNNYQNDWDGDNLADGVYYYILKLPDGSKYQGSVTILR